MASIDEAVSNHPIEPTFIHVMDTHTSMSYHHTIMACHHTIPACLDTCHGISSYKYVVINPLSIVKSSLLSKIY